jgi:hypothetical protein
VKIIIEIDPSLTDRMRELLKEVFPASHAHITKDLEGHDRIVHAEI